MIEAWLRWLELERGVLPSTLQTYERELRRLEARGIGDAQLLAVEDLREHVSDLAGAPATVAKRLAAFRSFYGFLARTGRRGDNPAAALDVPRRRLRLPRPVTELEARLRQLDPESRLVAVLMLETGLRVSEACTISCALPAPDALMVRGKGERDRLIPLTAAAREALTALGGRVRFRPRTLQRRFRRAGFTPHQLRHTFGCDLAEAGADLGEIQDLMGHASPATTRLYAAYGLDRLRRALDRRDRRNS